MQLKEKLDQYRRDFDGLYVCEFCGHEEKINGCYDDRNFHDNVSPRFKCSKCNKCSLDEGGEVKYVETKYMDGY